MNFVLHYTDEAKQTLEDLAVDPSSKRILKNVLQSLKFMETNLRHPSLNTHEYKNLTGPNGEKGFEAYAQQNTPGAHRILWYYGPGRGVLSIVAIIPHP